MRTSSRHISVPASLSTPRVAVVVAHGKKKKSKHHDGAGKKKKSTPHGQIDRPQSRKRRCVLLSNARRCFCTQVMLVFFSPTDDFEDPPGGDWQLATPSPLIPDRHHANQWAQDPSSVDPERLNIGKKHRVSPSKIASQQASRNHTAPTYIPIHPRYSPPPKKKTPERFRFNTHRPKVSYQEPPTSGCPRRRLRRCSRHPRPPRQQPEPIRL